MWRRTFTRGLLPQQLSVTVSAAWRIAIAEQE